MFDVLSLKLATELNLQNSHGLSELNIIFCYPVLSIVQKLPLPMREENGGKEFSGRPSAY